MMWIFGLSLDDQSLSFRAFGLHVVLPEEASVLLAAREHRFLVVVAVVGHSAELILVVLEV